MSRSKRRILIIAALAVLILGLAVGGKIAFDAWRYPISYASPANYGFAEVGAKIAEVLAEERPKVQLHRVRVPDLEASSAALEKGEVDLALVRSDLKTPANGQTIVMAGKDPAFLIVPAHSDIESFQDLKGKNIAVLRTGIDESPLLDRILGFYAVPPRSVSRSVMSAVEIAAALRQKQISAVFAVVSPATAPASDAFAAVAKAGKGAPDIIGIPEADTLAERLGNVESDEISQGAFGGAAPRPEENLATVFVTYRLMARHTMSDLVAGELTRVLMLARARLLPITPLATRIEAPDEDNDKSPIHPGAKAYFNNEQTSLLDHFESIFWLGTAMLSILASAAAWIISSLRGEQNRPAHYGARLLEILRQTRAADAEELEGLEDQLDEVVESLVDLGNSDQFGAEEKATLTFAVSQVREALRKRRESISLSKPKVELEPSV